MQIKQLTGIKNNPTLSWGHNGYDSYFIYKVNKTSRAFTLHKLKKHYSKKWVTTSKDIKTYNKLLAKGYSFGAYEKGELVGWIICDHRPWNNTLYIENILISEKDRGRGIGEKLVNEVKRKATLGKFRLIELETQNTNVSAIGFYQKQGFNITGINLKLYDKPDEEEVAIFMTFETGRDR